MIIINGLIVVNKPEGYTSRDVVNKLNHIFGTKKIGHTGTLDPIATGVLVCCIGSYTKLVNHLTSYDKEYITEIKLGIKTDTGDITGNVIEEDYNYDVNSDMILKVFKEFPKTYNQVVPKYSAVKINGKKLYEYARENIDIELPKREVNIYSLELLEFNNGIIKFKTKVSKGTYIRSLIEDLCIKLNVLGTMNSLIRTKQGNFDINMAVDLFDIDEHTHLLKTEEFLDVNTYTLNKKLYDLVINGNMLKISISNGYYNLIYNNELIALYEFKYNEGRLVMFY